MMQSNRVGSDKGWLERRGETAEYTVVVVI